MFIRNVGPGLYALGLEQNSMGTNRKSIENPNRDQAIHSRAQLCALGHRRLGAPSPNRRHPEERPLRRRITTMPTHSSSWRRAKLYWMRSFALLD